MASTVGNCGEDAYAGERPAAGASTYLDLDANSEPRMGEGTAQVVSLMGSPAESPSVLDPGRAKEPLLLYHASRSQRKLHVALLVELHRLRQIDRRQRHLLFSTVFGDAMDVRAFNPNITSQNGRPCLQSNNRHGLGGRGPDGFPRG